MSAKHQIYSVIFKRQCHFIDPITENPIMLNNRKILVKNPVRTCALMGFATPIYGNKKRAWVCVLLILSRFLQEDFFNKNFYSQTK